RDGHKVIRPETLPDYRSDIFFSEDHVIDWASAEDLLSGQEVWLPASAACLCFPKLYNSSTNGLASGNHLIEATLHALYEVIERDAVARLVEGDRLMIARDCRVIDPGSVRDPDLARVIHKIERSGTKVVLMQVLSGLPVPTYWAVLLNRQP